jgi:hypothetical protein
MQVAADCARPPPAPRTPPARRAARRRASTGAIVGSASPRASSALRCAATNAGHAATARKRRGRNEPSGGAARIHTGLLRLRPATAGSAVAARRVFANTYANTARSEATTHGQADGDVRDRRLPSQDLRQLVTRRRASATIVTAPHPHARRLRKARRAGRTRDQAVNEHAVERVGDDHAEAEHAADQQRTRRRRHSRRRRPQYVAT